MVAACLVGALLSACNPCNTVCADVGRELGRCMTTSFTWADLGARNEADWRGQCRDDWDRTAGALNTRELELALDVCALTLEDLDELDCEQIRALYGPL